MSSYVAHFGILWGFPSLEHLLSHQEFAARTQYFMIVRWPEDRKEVRPRQRNRQPYFGLKIYTILIFRLVDANDVEICV